MMIHNFRQCSLVYSVKVKLKTNYFANWLKHKNTNNGFIDKLKVLKS